MRTLSTLCADLSSVASKWFFFFFNDTATTEIYTLSLHDALPICRAHPKPADLQSRKPLIQRKTQMTKLTTTLLATCLALAGATTAFAADEMAKDGMSNGAMSKDSMSKDGMKKDSMAKDGMKKDSMSKDGMKKDSMSKDGMHKDGMHKDGMSKDGMKKDSMGKDAMSK